MATKTLHNITLLGLGAMGCALARGLLRAGHNLHVWNRSKDRAEVATITKEGAHLKDSASSAIQSSYVIIICLLGSASVYAVLEGVEEAALKGRIIVNLSIANASEAPKMTEWMHQRLVKPFFAGAIMHTPNHVGSEHALIFIGGDSAEAFAAIECSSNGIGFLDYVGADPSAAALHDGALLAAMYGLAGGCITAIALSLARLSRLFRAGKRY